MLDEQRLQLIVVKGFIAELDVFVADVGQDSRLRVQVVVLPGFGHDRPLDVAEQPR